MRTLTNCRLVLVPFQAAEAVDVTDMTVLVIGTQVPWLEAILLSRLDKDELIQYVGLATLV